MSFKKKEDFKYVARMGKRECLLILVSPTDCGVHPSCKALLALQKLM